MRSVLSQEQDGVGQTPSGVVAVREFRGRTMGTTYMVKIAGADELDTRALRVAIDAELRRVNDEMSTYLKSSQISRFNQSSSTDWFDVSDDFARVVELAEDIAAKTEGAFDVTVGPLVNAWSFGTTERSQTVPDSDTIKTLMRSIGYQKLQVRRSPPSLRKSVAELQIDLSSIAKGHGVDRVLEMLSARGADNVFVEIGGEVRTIGEKPEGAWRVGIQLPDAARDRVMIAHPMRIGEPAGTAMATSGDYRNNFTADGKRYSHTIDPRSGSPVDHRLASVTVVAATCMEADGWATALNAVGPETALEIAARNGLHTLLVTRTDSGTFEMVGTGILAQYAAAEPAVGGAMDWLSAVVPIAILTFGVFSILLFAMAIGVVFGRKSISGSCGGLANKTNEDGSTSCALCSSPSDACKELRDKMAESK
jgi:thiamine biosynthesis lipoprotein